MKLMRLNNKGETVIDVLGLVSIGLCLLGYFLFGRVFAELHVQLFFLDFPIFIGDILVLFAGALLFLKWSMKGYPMTFWHGMILLYAVFVCMKAWQGYQETGPFALRNSALFYYPVFALFGFAFYKKRYFESHLNLWLAGVISLALRIFPFFGDFTLPATLITVILIKKAPASRRVKILFYTGFLLCIPYAQFFQASRTTILGHTFALLFFVTSFFVLLPLKNIYKVCLIVGCLILFGVGIVNLSNRALIMSMLNIGQVIEKHYDVERQLALKITDPYVYHQPLKVYNPQKKNTEKGLETELETKVVGLRNEKKLYNYTFSVAQNNILFRLYIWRDALRLLWRDKALLGFHLGRPIRSPTLEALSWGESEWSRDGWIAAHNSYVTIIYYSGILGIGLIALMLCAFGAAVINAVRYKSYIGILLGTILVYWLTAANTMLILEMPYNAVCFWFLFSLMVAGTRDYENPSHS